MPATAPSRKRKDRVFESNDMVRRLLGSSPHRTTPGAVKTFGGWYQFETM